MSPQDLPQDVQVAIETLLNLEEVWDTAVVNARDNYPWEKETPVEPFFASLVALSNWFNNENFTPEQHMLRHGKPEPVA